MLVTPSLVGWWRFEGNANDSSGKGNNGTVHGSSLDTGKFGRCYSFDGVDDYVDCGAGASLDITDAITIEVWVYSNGDARYEHIVSKRQADSQTQYGLLKTNTQKIMFEYGKLDGSWNGVSGDDFPLNQWTHVAVTVKGTAYNFYIAGQAAGNGNLANAIPSLPAVSLRIGYYDGSYDERWDGLIDEVHIYNRALSPQEIRSLYEAPYQFIIPQRSIVRDYFVWGPQQRSGILNLLL